jgi:hypothetical protein
MATWQMRGLLPFAIRSGAGSWPLMIIFHVIVHFIATSLGLRARTPYHAERTGARSLSASTVRWAVSRTRSGEISAGSRLRSVSWEISADSHRPARRRGAAGKPTSVNQVTDAEVFLVLILGRGGAGRGGRAGRCSGVAHTVIVVLTSLAVVVGIEVARVVRVPLELRLRRLLGTEPRAVVLVCLRQAGVVGCANSSQATRRVKPPASTRATMNILSATRCILTASFSDVSYVYVIWEGGIGCAIRRQNTMCAR